MSIEAEIREKLSEAFRPTRLEVVNESHRHAGHAGDDGSGESHFAVLIRGAVAADFKKGEKSREEITDLMAGGASMANLEAEIESHHQSQPA